MVRAEVPARLQERPQLRRLVDGVGQPGRRADRKGNRRRCAVVVLQRRSFASCESRLFQGLDKYTQALTRYRMEIYRKVAYGCYWPGFAEQICAGSRYISCCAMCYLRAPGSIPLWRARSNRSSIFVASD